MRVDSRKILAEATRQEWVEALRELHQAEQEFTELGDDLSYQRLVEARSRVGRIYQLLKWYKPQQLEEADTSRKDRLDLLIGSLDRMTRIIGWLLIASLLVMVVIHVAIWWR